MPDPVCPRCGVPLRDQPDYCWSCGYFVGDRWQDVRLGEGSAPGEVIDRTASPDDLRVVSGIAPPASAGRSLLPLIATGLVVVLALAAVLVLADGRIGAPVGSAAERSAGASRTDASAGGSVAPAPSRTHGSPAPAAPLAPTGATTPATVTRVVDGDTIIVDIDGKPYRVRYIGMDTPESVKPDTPVEPLAEEAAAANHALVDGRPVLLERDVSETDRYDRLLRNVWVERDGVLVMVGLELVREGYAQVSTFPPDVRYVDELLAAQAQARADGVGLWASGEPPPS